jgi:hypothetical protein
MVDIPFLSISPFDTSNQGDTTLRMSLYSTQGSASLRCVINASLPREVLKACPLKRVRRKVLNFYSIVSDLFPNLIWIVHVN